MRGEEDGPAKEEAIGMWTGKEIDDSIEATASRHSTRDNVTFVLYQQKVIERQLMEQVAKSTGDGVMEE